MINVNVKELRAHLRQYMELIEQGETLNIIRNSRVIGHIKPSAEVKAQLDKTKLLQLGEPLKLLNQKEIMFRRFGRFEDPSPITRLHKLALEAAGAYADDPALDRDLNDPASNYENLGGEFWVGEIDGEIVAMGAFRLSLQPHSGKNEAELKRMRVRPDLQGQGIGSALLKLLEKRVAKSNYRTIALDTVGDTPAQAFYERHGYRETRREPADNFELIFYQKEL